MNTHTKVHPYIESIDRAYAEGIDTWEMMVSLGASDEEDMGVLRWRQGDLAVRVEKHYGGETLSKYASAIHVKYPTLKQRRQMSHFYEPDTRVSFPTLSYSHYREAMRTGEFNIAFDALFKAQLREWPVWKFEQFIDRYLGKGRPNASTIEGQITDRFFIPAGNFITIQIHDASDWIPGMTVRLKKGK